MLVIGVICVGFLLAVPLYNVLQKGSLSDKDIVDSAVEDINSHIYSLSAVDTGVHHYTALAPIDIVVRSSTITITRGSYRRDFGFATPPAPTLAPTTTTTTTLPSSCSSFSSCSPCTDAGGCMWWSCWDGWPWASSGCSLEGYCNTGCTCTSSPSSCSGTTTTTLPMCPSGCQQEVDCQLYETCDYINYNCQAYGTCCCVSTIDTTTTTIPSRCSPYSSCSSCTNGGCMWWSCSFLWFTTTGCDSNSGCNWNCFCTSSPSDCGEETTTTTSTTTTTQLGCPYPCMYLVSGKVSSQHICIVKSTIGGVPRVSICDSSDKLCCTPILG